MSSLRRPGAGILLCLTIVSAIVQAFPIGVSRTVPGVFGWLAALLLAPELPRRSRAQALVLIALGLIGLTWGAIRGVSPDWARVVSANASLIALLSAVSFLRLLTPPEQPPGPMPTGKRALWATFASVQFLGAIINLSALFIMADRMASGGRPERRQIIVLSRGFAGAALWSPFFAAMAAALTFAPGARVSDLVISGLALSVLGLWLTLREISADTPQPFVGYPVHASALLTPAGLAVAVIGLHFAAPSVSVLAWVSLLAPVTACAVVLTRGKGWRPIAHHVVDGVTRGGSELTLFLAAGVLAGGLGSVAATLGGWVPFEEFGGLEAAATFTMLLGLSIVGVHPVIGIATFGTVLATLKPDPTLLAMTFLSAWSFGALVNPLSGVTLAIQARYSVDGLTQLRWHLGYVLKLALAALLALNLYALLQIG